MKDQSDNPSHHERTLLPRSSVCLYSSCCTTHVYTIYKPTDDINTWILCAKLYLLQIRIHLLDSRQLLYCTSSGIFYNTHKPVHNASWLKQVWFCLTSRLRSMLNYTYFVSFYSSYFLFSGHHGNDTSSSIKLRLKSLSNFLHLI